ncbi:MAG: 2-phosphosulfolactate phosphatase [Bacillota bacterium]
MFVDLLMRTEDMLPDEMPGKTAVIIDVLRATSTIVTALANGCQEIIPVLTPEEAFHCRPALPEGSCLLAGERHGLLIPGFDLGNSPREYTADMVGGKSIIITTSNGTRAIKGGEAAKEILIGSFLNARAVAREIASLGNNVILICAGTLGRFSLDDFLAAGAILFRLKTIFPQADYSDAAQGAAMLFASCQEDLVEILGSCVHGTKLKDLGFESDLEFCTVLDRWDIVPVCQHGKIREKYSKNIG